MTTSFEAIVLVFIPCSLFFDPFDLSIRRFVYLLMGDKLGNLKMSNLIAIRWGRDLRNHIGERKVDFVSHFSK